MKLAEIAFACYIYAHMSDYDSSYLRFTKNTEPQLDLRLEHHRIALLNWLNDWGCRQFAKDYHGLAADEIRKWYDEIGGQLFPIDTPLLSLSDHDIKLVELAYASLVARTASRRRLHNGGETQVVIGPTGAAKILFVLRPMALIPWDDPIRERFHADGSARSYMSFLRIVKSNLEELSQACQTKGYKLTELPQLLGRPSSSVTKLVDEYFWVTISRGCPVPAEDELNRWASWQ